jgi:hypothetical protein
MQSRPEGFSPLQHIPSVVTMLLQNSHEVPLQNSFIIWHVLDNEQDIQSAGQFPMFSVGPHWLSPQEPPSVWHTEEHPSPGVWLPSSQVSGGSVMLLPHTGPPRQSALAGDSSLQHIESLSIPGEHGAQCPGLVFGLQYWAPLQ